LEATREWDAHQRASSYLFRGERLAAVRHAEARWRSDPDRHPALPEAGREFLDVSIRAQTRTRRRIRAVALILVAATALSLTTIGWAVSSQRSSTEQRNISASRQLASRSQQSSSTDPVKAAQLAVAAQSVRKTPEGRAALRNVLSQAARDVLSEYQGGTPEALASGRDGHLLAIGDSDGTVALWDVRKHRQRNTVRSSKSVGHMAVALSPDGRTLAATGSVNGQPVIRLWNVSPFKELGRLPISPDNGAIAFTSDGQRLAVDDGRGIRLWKVRTTPSDSHLSPAGDTYIPYARSTSTRILVSPDATKTAISTESENGSSLELFDLSTGIRNKVELKGHAAILGPGGKYALVEQEQKDFNYVYIYDLSSGRATNENLPYPLSNSPFSVGAIGPFSADGRLVVIDNKLWDVASGDLVGSIDTGVWASTRLMSFVGKDTVASIDIGAGQANIRLWNIRVNQPEGPPQHLMVGAYAFSPDGQTIASDVRRANGACYIQIRDVIKGGVKRLPISGSVDGECGYPLAVAADKRTFALGFGSAKIGIWKSDSQGWFVLDSGLGDDMITEAIFSPDGRTLATVTRLGKVQLWDMKKQTLKDESPLLKAVSGVTALAFTKDSKLLAVGFGQTFQVYDLSGRKEFRAPGNVPVGGVTALAFSPDMRTLAIGGKKMIMLWDTREQGPKGMFMTGHTGMVTSMAYTPDGSTLASGDDGGTLPTDGTEGAQVKLWDTATQSQIGSALASVGGVRFLGFPDSSSLVVGEDNHFDDSLTVGHWGIGLPPDPEAAACAIAGSFLTPDEWRRYVPAGIDYRDPCPKNRRS
jgi:WD40 repeat protein